MPARFHATGRAFVIMAVLCFVLASFFPGGARGASSPPTDGESGENAGGGTLPRYWVEEAYRMGDQAEISGTESLSFLFSPHPEMCRAAYRNDWYSICQRRTGLSGRPARGVSLDPPFGGEWRWQSDTSLVFSPAGAWPAGESFSVALEPDALPPGTELLTPLRFRTAELMPQAQGAFQFDRQDLSVMAVSGSLAFNYPMDRQSVLSLLEFEGSGGGDGLLLGRPSFSWNGDRRLLFSVPVLSLPEGGSDFRLVLKPGSLASSGGSDGKGLDWKLALPGKNGLFTLERATALTVTGDDLRARQMLALEFSLPARAREVLPALSVLLLPRQRIQSSPEPPAPYRWWNMEEITPEVLAQATPVELVPLDGEEASPLLSFGFQEETEPGRTLLVNVRQGARGAAGMDLAKSSAFLAQVPAFAEELRIMQNGAVLALTGDKTLSLYSRNLDSVSWSIAQVRPEFINHFVSSNMGSFEEPESYYEIPWIWRRFWKTEARDCSASCWGACATGSFAPPTSVSCW